MAMDVKKPDASVQLQRVWDGKLRTPLHSLFEVYFVLAHDILHHQRNGNAFHIVGQSLAEAIVHVDLPDWGHENYIDRNQAFDCTHLSPFWKSTTNVGTKNP
jgi:hypothetical protein